MTLSIKASVQITNLVAAFLRSSNYSQFLDNNSSYLRNNETDDSFQIEGDSLEDLGRDPHYVTSLPAVKAFFYCLYVVIFSTGIFGNVLVCYVVFRNKHMQTVTNYFITNLALSDILLCTFAVPFTPLYIFMRQWVFGRALCHLVSYAQGVSVYISAFTLMSIAIDRFFVILYPFRARLQIWLCLLIVVCVWVAAAILTLPYGIFVKLVYEEEDDAAYCEEIWPYELGRRVFGFSTSILQFVVPFVIISFCYMQVCVKLRDRAKCKPGAKSVKKEELERERTRRTNRMLISMVVIFGASWLPLNVYNLVQDFYIPAAQWDYSTAFFLLAHAVAMSSTCYNPLLYAWLNENFRKEFKQVLPCFATVAAATSNRRLNSAKTERTCNGHETLQETLLLQQQHSPAQVRPGTLYTLPSASAGMCAPENVSTLLLDPQKDTAVRYSSDTDTVKLQLTAHSDSEAI